MATFSLKAVLGFVADQFTAGIQGAEQKATSFSKSVNNIGKMMKVAFAGEMVQKFLATVRQIKDFQNEKGVQIISPEDLARIDDATTKIEMMWLKFKAGAVSAVAVGMKWYERIAYANQGQNFGPQEEAAEAASEAARMAPLKEQLMVAKERLAEAKASQEIEDKITRNKEKQVTIEGRLATALVDENTTEEEYTKLLFQQNELRIEAVSLEQALVKEAEKLAEKRNDARLAEKKAQQDADDFYISEMRDQAAADAKAAQALQDKYAKIGGFKGRSQFGAASGFEGMGASMGGASVLANLRNEDLQKQANRYAQEIMGNTAKIAEYIQKGKDRVASLGGGDITG